MKKKKIQQKIKKVRISVYLLEDSANTLKQDGAEFGLPPAKWLAVLASQKALVEAVKEKIRNGEIIIAL